MRPGIPLIFTVCLVIVSSFACSSGGGPGASTGGSGAEAVARRAMAAIIGGDMPRYLNEMRPDYRPTCGISVTCDDVQKLMSQVQGCPLDRAQFLTQQQDLSIFNVSVAFEHPCGSNASGQPFATCGLELDLLSGNYYVAWAWCSTF
jgi:hypothetical protein